MRTQYPEQYHDNIIAVVPMDGYHLPRIELDKMPNRDEAYRRRGAHWTFDVKSLSNVLSQLVTMEGDVKVHGWGHEIKDPSYDAITVSSTTKIVIIEGLYLLLEEGDWAKDIVSKAAKRIFLDIDPAITIARGSKRNYEAGICQTMEDSIARWHSNDLQNGMCSNNSKLIVIISNFYGAIIF